ncbi:MAG: UvrD-helicase domain-containing protein, partial [Rhodothermia bacterium]
MRRFVIQTDTEATGAALSLDYRNVLNDQQYAVVASGRGPSLVVAGAGTGKTRTLIYRVAYLVETG